jgi:hypothetical protein
VPNLRQAFGCSARHRPVLQRDLSFTGMAASRNRRKTYEESPMKLIETNDETVTLLLAREEFHLLRDTTWAAIQGLEANLSRHKPLAEKLQGMSEDEVCEALGDEDVNADSLEELQDEIKQEQKLLAQAQAQAESLERITTEGDLARLL